MKIKCDSCGAVYNISEDKLTKDVSKATCKKCGAKIVIRRQGSAAEGLDDLRAGRGAEEENVINHEERTVIAQVPELKNGELPIGATSSEDVVRTFGPEAAASPAAGGTPAEPARTDVSLRPMSFKVPEAAGGASGGVPGPAPMATEVPTPPMPSAASVTVDTSPSRPSGVASAPIQSKVTSQAPIAPSPQKRPNVTEIFGNAESKPSSEDEFRQLPQLPLILLGLALGGVLTFIHAGLWRVSLVTEAGFLFALYAIGVAMMAYADLLRSTARIRYVRVLVVPAVICVAILAVLSLLSRPQEAPAPTGTDAIQSRRPLGEGGVGTQVLSLAAFGSDNRLS